MFSNTNYSYHGGIPKQYLRLKDKEFSEWEIPPWNLFINENILLGQGNYGKVYFALWNETEVVAKVINQNLSKKNRELFVKELNVLTKIHHPNIVQVLGYVSEPFIIVIEYLQKGELLNYSQKKWLTKKKKINICLDILKALTYLHNRKPNYIIHRDIKPQNILMTPSGRAKIADFGLSRLLKIKSDIIKEKEEKQEKEEKEEKEDDKDLTQTVGSLRYMAPEVKNSNNYTYKIDIWSVGVIFYELFEEERYIPKNGFIWNRTPKQIKDIISDNMIQTDANKRYDAIDLILKFKEIKKTCGKYCLNFC